MKNYKEEIIARMIEKSVDEKIVSLRETAAEFGIKHISAQDCRDILSRLQKVEGSRPVQIMSNKYDSLFCSLCLVDNTVEIDGAAC